MHPRAEEFERRIAEAFDRSPTINELPEETKTAQQAADAIGCDVAQIVKSLVVAVEDEHALVLTSGANEVDLTSLANSLDVDTDVVSITDPETVKAVTGWSIGGVPPVCHDTSLPTYIDPTLLDHDRVWAGAGTPHAVVAFEAGDLLELTDATPIDAFRPV